MKAALILLIEGATMLFAAFGGFLTVVAPPPGANDTVSAVGLASFVAVVIFALVKLLLALVDPKTMRRVTVALALISGGAFIWIGLSYLIAIDASTFRFPDGDSDGAILLAADEYAEEAKLLLEKKPELEGAHAALLASVGETEMYRIWRPKDVVAKRAELTFSYVSMVLALTLSLGFSIEGLVLAGQKGNDT